MRTTSYDISKELFKIGFCAKEFLFAYKDQGSTQLWNVKLWPKDEKQIFYPSYDLETILEALPKEITIPEFGEEEGILELTFPHENGRGTIAYNFHKIKNAWGIFNINQRCKESMADIAGKMLLQLHEKGLVKFDEVKP